MSESARILQFPRRKERAFLSPEEAESVAIGYLKTPDVERTDELRDAFICDAEVLTAICKELRDRKDVAPPFVLAEATDLYAWIARRAQVVGLFDERDYFLGELALIAAIAARYVGDKDETERWLDRSEASFRLTVNPGPLLSNVAYARLSLKFDRARFDDVLELLPALLASFERLGMKSEGFKARFLEAAALRDAGRLEDSFGRLQALRDELVRHEDAGLLGQVLVLMGNHLGAHQRFEEAVQAYEAALPNIKKGNRPIALAELKWSIGDTYRVQGACSKALDSYRAAQRDLLSLGLKPRVANVGLAIAESLLALGRPREAEWEILQALPTIEEQKMVPEGFAAVALLRESIKLQKADPNALRDLREHLQKQN